jgi:hypothetical protein
VKRLAAALGLVAALGGDAAARDLTAADFNWRATLATERAEGLHVLQLGQEPLVAATTSEPRDLRIFNASGEALPVVLLPGMVPTEPARAPPTPLRMAPLPGTPQARQRALADFAFRLERDREHTVLEVGPGTDGGAAADAHDPGGYLLDLRPLKDKQGELSLHFAADAPDYANPVTISGSDDLVSWHPVASGSLARNRQLGGNVERSSFELSRPPAFARVQWPAGAAPKLDAASFIERLPAPVAPAPRTPLALAMLQDGEWLIDVPVGLPLTRIVIRVAQPNQALRVDLLCPQQGAILADRERLLRELSRRTAPEPWFTCARDVEVFKADRAGQWVENPPVAIAGRPTRLLLQIVDPKDYRGAAPSVEAEWTPLRLAFLARGPGPYQLAVGHEAADEGPRLDLAGMLPRDDPYGSGLPVARVLHVVRTDITKEPTRAALAARTQARWRWALWAVLLLAVAALALMAWWLARNIRASDAR